MNVGKSDLSGLLESGLFPSFKKRAAGYERSMGPILQFVRPRYLDLNTATPQVDIEFGLVPVGSWACPHLFKVVRLSVDIVGVWKPHRFESWDAFEAFAKTDSGRIADALRRFSDSDTFLQFFDFLPPALLWLFEVDLALAGGLEAEAAALWDRRTAVRPTETSSHYRLLDAMAIHRLGGFLGYTTAAKWSALATAALAAADADASRYPRCHSLLITETRRLLASFEGEDVASSA